MPNNDKNDKDDADPFFQCLTTLRNTVVAPPPTQQPAPAAAATTTTTTTTLLQADLTSLGQQRKSLDQALHDALVDRQVTNDALETQLATNRQMQRQQAKLRQDLETLTTQHEAKLQRELDAQVQAATATAAAQTALSQLEARTVVLELHAAELQQAVAHKTERVQQARQQGQQNQVARQATMETLQADLIEAKTLLQESKEIVMKARQSPSTTRQGKPKDNGNAATTENCDKSLEVVEANDPSSRIAQSTLSPPTTTVTNVETSNLPNTDQQFANTGRKSSAEARSFVMQHTSQLEKLEENKDSVDLEQAHKVETANAQASAAAKRKSSNRGQKDKDAESQQQSPVTRESQDDEACPEIPGDEQSQRNRTNDALTNVRLSKRQKISTGDWVGHALNIRHAIVESHQDKFLSEIVESDLSVLKGIGSAALTALRGMRLETIRDLGEYRFWKIAKAMKILSKTEGKRMPCARMNLDNGLNKEHESKSFKQILQLPVSALQGLSTKADNALRQLGIETIEEFASFEYAAIAEAIVLLSPYEETRTNEERRLSRLRQRLS